MLTVSIHPDALNRATLSEYHSFAAEVLMCGDLIRRKKSDLMRRFHEILGLGPKPRQRTVFDCLPFRQNEVRRPYIAVGGASLIGLEVTEYPDDIKARPLAVDADFLVGNLPARVAMTLDRQADEFAALLLGVTGAEATLPRRFQKELLTNAVGAGFDPFEYLWRVMQWDWVAPHHVGAPPWLVASIRVMRLSIQEKVFHLFHIACGFFGTRKVDARNCP